MKPPLRTSLRLQAQEAHGDVRLKNHAVLDDTGTLRVELLDALIVSGGGTVSATALDSIIEAGCSVVWESKRGVISFTPALREHSAAFVQRQAECASRKTDRLQAIRRMMDIRFGEKPPKSYAENEIRGWEGLRMSRLFRALAKEHGVSWSGRENDPSHRFQDADAINRALSSAFATLYREVHLAVLVMGMSPALGMLHRGDPRSFVFDMADIYKNEVAEEVFALFPRGEYVDREWIATLVRENFVRDAKEVLWG